LAYSREQLSRTFRKLFNFSFFSAKFKAWHDVIPNLSWILI
jgi:hypothetical protein